MIDEVTAYLRDAIEALKKLPPSRERALAITKIEEALMWWQKSND